MAITAQFLRNIMAEARPIIERQMNDAKLIAALRTVVANNGGDWGALKALIKAHVEDENDEAGEGKRVQKICDKADSTSAYADMLGLANMNENNFSEASQSYAEVKGAQPHNISAPLTEVEIEELSRRGPGEITEHEQPETAQNEPETAAEVAGDYLREPVAAEQGQIIREGDAPRETDRESGDASCPDAEFQVGENVQVTTAARNDAGKQGVTAGETAAEADAAELTMAACRAVIVGTAASASAPHSNPQPSPLSGADKPEAVSPPSTPTVSGALSDDDVPAFIRRDYVLRPHCLNPSLCAGSGREHCHRCKRAMAESEAA